MDQYMMNYQNSIIAINHSYMKHKNPVNQVVT